MSEKAIYSLVLVLYMGLLIIVGLLTSRKLRNVEDFYIGGRKVGPWVTALSYVAAYFSSAVIIGGGGFGYKYGMATLWIGAANVLFGCTLAWIVLGRRLREFTTRLKTMTVPGFLAERFSAKEARILSAVAIAVFLVVYNVSILKGMGHIFEVLMGMPCAKENLYLRSAQDYGGKRPREPSLFVSEALDLPPAEIKDLKGSPLATITRHGKAKPSPATPIEEELVLLPRGKAVLELSHQKIDDYLICPMKYRYIHVLKVPIRRHHAVIYGYAIHQAIKLYNMNRIAGRKTTIADLKEIFRKAWHTEGFLTRHHEELRFQEGLKALEYFHAHASEDGVIPTYVERHFSFNESSIRIVGIFGRIDVIDGDGTIIDYKTSAVTDEKQAIKRTKESRQLAIYALAYERLFGNTPVRLELRFLTPQVIIGRYEPSEKTIKKALSDIESAATGIHAGRFPADPTYLACTYCPYRSICPAKRSD